MEPGREPSPETFNPILEKINAPWPKPKSRKSWFFDRCVSWRDAVVVLVWMVLFIGSLPYVFGMWGYGNDYLTVHLSFTFFLSVWVATAGAVLAFLMVKD